MLPAFAVDGALIYVALLMMSSLKALDWDDLTEYAYSVKSSQSNALSELIISRATYIRAPSTANAGNISAKGSKKRPAFFYYL